MGDEPELLDDFSVVKVLLKAGVTFVLGFLGGLQILSGFWEPAEICRKWLYSEWLATPALFIAFFALFLFVEAVQRSQRKEMESRRSNPSWRRRLPPNAAFPRTPRKRK